MAGFSYLSNGYMAKRSGSCKEGVVIFCLEGYMKVKYGDEIFYHSRENVIVIPALSENSYWVETSCKIIWFNFRSDVINNNRFLIKKSIFGYSLEKSVDMLFEAYRFNFDETVLEYLENIIAFYLQQELKFEQMHHQIDAKLAKLAKLIQNNPQNDWNINSLSKAISVSYQSLYKICKKNMGVSPVKYLRKIRVELTKDYLINTNYSIDSIAVLVGYSDGFCLSKAFKAETFYSPKEWRKFNQLLT